MLDVDVVTVPNLSEHLSSADTTAQLSARFAYAAAMKSINNLLLLGDGESWNRQSVDFAGLPEMVRTFLQVAAGAADIPVTRLLGQSPAGLSTTGDSDTRNDYDMISARQELDLRPQLERLDRLILRSEGIDPAALSFEFRPLLRMDAATKATVALSKAQATQVYAGLGLWPVAVTARLVEAQLVEDGTYPNTEAIFAEASTAATATGSGDTRPALDFDPAQPRDPQGRWTGGGESTVSSALGTVPTGRRGGVDPKPRSQSAAGGILGVLGMLNPVGAPAAQEVDPDEENRGLAGESADPVAALRSARFKEAWRSLREIDPTNRNLETLKPPGDVPTEADIERIEGAARQAAIARTCDFLRPNGQTIGQRGTSSDIRLMSGGLAAAQRDYDYMSTGGTPLPMPDGSRVKLPGEAGFITLRPVMSTPGSPG